MLIDARLESRLPPEVRAILGITPHRIGVGLYENCGFNLSNLVGDGWEHFDTLDPEIPAYGVVDSVEQFMAKFGELLEKSPYEYAVGFTRVRKADQEPDGGWRWHKWGEYFGTHEITHEYLYDEPNIDSVTTFEVLRKKVELRSVSTSSRLDILQQLAIGKTADDEET